MRWEIELDGRTTLIGQIRELRRRDNRERENDMEYVYSGSKEGRKKDQTERQTHLDSRYT